MSEQTARPPLSNAASLAQILALAMAPAIGLGIARFGYALVLPDMQASLSWNYAQAGFMNTINAAGYFVGALSAPRLTARFSEWNCTVWGTVLVTLAIVLTGLSDDFIVMSTARLLAGVGASISLVAGGTKAARFAGQTRNPARTLGLFYVGPCIGMLVTGLTIPGFIEWSGPGSWTWAWLIMAGIATGLALLLVVGAPKDDARTEGRRAPAQRAAIRPMLPALTGYFMFGAGYIAYMTFMIAWVQGNGGGSLMQSVFWCVLAITGIIGTAPLSSLAGRMEGGRGLSIVTLLVMIGAGLPLVIPDFTGLMISALAFGLSFFSVVTATTLFIRRNLPSEQWASGIAIMTITFSLGQVAGPVMTGFISDMTGQLDLGLWISTGLLGIGVIAGWLQPRLTK